MVAAAAAMAPPVPVAASLGGLATGNALHVVRTTLPAATAATSAAPVTGAAAAAVAEAAATVAAAAVTATIVAMTVAQ